MNSEKPTPQDYLNNLYQFFCAAVQQDKSVYFPKNICKVEHSFQELMRYIEKCEKPIKVNGYVPEK